jgi:lambda family phage tail tape measure protein
MSLISRLGVVLGLDAGEFNAGLGKAQDGLKEFAASSLGAKLTIAGLAVAFAEFARSAVEYADQIAQVAKTNDMAVSTVLALNEALVEAGGSMEGASRMMSGFAKQVDAAAEGSDKTREIFKNLGVSLKDLKNLSTDDLLLKTLKGLNDIEQSSARNAKAMELFGKAIRGVDIKELYENMERLKDTNKGAAESFMQTKASMDAVAGAMAQAKTDFIQTFAPAIEGLTKLFLTLGHAIGTAGRAVKDLVNRDWQDFKNYDWAGVQFEKDLNARFEKARAESLLAQQQQTQGGRDVKPLSEEAKKQNDELERQIRTLQLEAQTVGTVKSKFAELNLEFEKGGKYEKLRGTQMEANAKAAAQAYDAAKAREFVRAEMESAKNQEQIYELQVKTAGLSDTQRKKQEELLKVHQQIADIERQHPELTKQQIQAIEQEKVAMVNMEETAKRTQNTFENGWSRAYENFKEKSMDSFAQGQQAFDSFASNMGSALDKFVQTGKLSFSDLARSIIADLIKIQLQAQLTSMFKGLSGLFGFGGAVGGGGFVSSLGTIGSSLAISGHAEGGSISGPSIVGERGPELFVPSSPGSIVPNHQLSSMFGNQPQVVYNGPYINNMSAIDTQSATQFLAKNKQGVWAANQSAQLSLPQSR